MASRLMLSLKNFSLLIVQPADTDGKLPQRASFESLDESNASLRKLNCKK